MGIVCGGSVVVGICLMGFYDWPVVVDGGGYEFYGLVLGLGLWFDFGFVFVCDFGGWGLRLWAVVAVVVGVGGGGW